MQSLQKAQFHLHNRGDFDKLFPELPPLRLSENEIRELAETMVQSSFWDDSSRITNGMAIFSQFLAHDITFESISKLRGVHQPNFLVNDRTFNLDLDCLYGQWTQDFYYDKENKNKLLLGKRYEDEELSASWYDLQRNQQAIAIIPDARNDENIIVSRMQVLFIEFHNKVVDLLERHEGKYSSTFLEARKIVTWCYQWLIIHEYLPKVVQPHIWEKAYRGKANIYTHPYYLPLEFSGAVFRLGHSQTRESNRINARSEKNLFDLGSFEEMDEYVDWRYLFDFGDEKVQHAKLIDTKLDSAFGNISFIPSNDPWERNLAYRNLKRGQVYGLASGEHIAQRMSITPIEVPETKRMKGTPLWYYILKEAEVLEEGQCLGPVGSTILAETFFTLLGFDNNSYLNIHPLWVPPFAKSDGTFDFVDLIKFVYPENY